MNNKEVIANAYQSFANGDMPGVLGVFDENIEWTEAEGFPYGGVYTGADAIVKNVFMKIATEWENFTVVPDEFLDAGDRIVELGNYSGTYKTSGKSMRVPFAHVWTLRGGKIVKFVQYTDTLKISEAL